MTIKKQFEDIYAMLEENKNKKVSTILEDLTKLMTTKTQKTFRTNEEGELEVYCYYHKEWENTTQVSYGKKSSTATGLNTMCKEGVSHWTKAQRVKRQSESALKDQLLAGELTVEECNKALIELKNESTEIISLSE